MRKPELPALTFPRPFMYGIREPGGSARMDDCCVGLNRESLENIYVHELNQGLEDGDEPYRVVALYTAEQVETMLAGRQ